MNPTCSTCKFWKKEKTDGTCTRFPPLVMIAGVVMNPITRQQQPGFTSAFPTVRGDLTCGEHQTKIERMQ